MSSIEEDIETKNEKKQVLLAIAAIVVLFLIWNFIS